MLVLGRLAYVQGDLCKFGQATVAVLVSLNIAGLNTWRGKVCLTFDFRVILDIVTIKIIREVLLI